MQISRSAGGIVLGDHGAIALVLVRGGDGAWLFPKGHVDHDENDGAAARREIHEETGLDDLELLDDLGVYTRPHIQKDGSHNVLEQKEIHMFLFATDSGATLLPTMEIESAEWVPYREVAERIGNDQDRVWFSSVFDRVKQAIQRD